MKKGGHLDGLLLLDPTHDSSCGACKKKATELFCNSLANIFFAADRTHRHRMGGGKEKKPVRYKLKTKYKYGGSAGFRNDVLYVWCILQCTTKCTFILIKMSFYNTCSLSLSPQSPPGPRPWPSTCCPPPPGRSSPRPSSSPRPPPTPGPCSRRRRRCSGRRG